MKERENREFWIRQTTTLLTMLSIDIFILSSPGFFRVRQNPDPARTKRSKGRLSPLPGPDKTGYLKKKQDVFLLHKNSCQGAIPLDP